MACFHLTPLFLADRTINIKLDKSQQISADKYINDAVTKNTIIAVLFQAFKAKYYISSDSTTTATDTK